MIDANKLSIGILLPIESYEGAIPKMENQVQLIQRAEALGYDSVWVRDIPLNNPDFKEVGQIFHPLHVAKASASLDVLFPNRFVMGIASGDRPVEYPAFNKPFELRSAHVAEHIQMLKKLWSTDFPTYNNDYGTLMEKVGDVLPKPIHKNIPMYATGHIGGVNLDWIAKHTDGWIYYPRDFAFTKKIVEDWHEALKKEGEPAKPYIQPVYIDLMEDPDFEPQKMDLGFRLGRNYLVDMFHELGKIGVNHIMLVLKYCSRPAGEVLEEIGKEVLPQLR